MQIISNTIEGAATLYTLIGANRLKDVN